MKPEDIKNKKIAVRCDTIEKAKRFLGMRIGKHNCQMEQDEMIDLILNRKDNCLYIQDEIVCFFTEEWCESHDYTIITFEKFMEEPLTAVEVLGVLVNEYATGKYDEIFGCDPYYSELTRRFTPAEIVQKITEWKRKQNKQIRVTEDMIADALDEKYGIGNWGREE